MIMIISSSNFKLGFKVTTSTTTPPFPIREKRPLKLWGLSDSSNLSKPYKAAQTWKMFLVETQTERVREREGSITFKAPYYNGMRRVASPKIEHMMMVIRWFSVQTAVTCPKVKRITVIFQSRARCTGDKWQERPAYYFRNDTHTDRNTILNRSPRSPRLFR